ncbi:unnamed protein product [Cylindrotheca closterium]|uniref:Uncharacterized protein n=1 Tax=Cylindrotheca closterium TaxID=2856 RepID=A0AAD2CG49_9STRA|nr:unnamed protein product [Cylindrotheca closterium]
MSGLYTETSEKEFKTIETNYFGLRTYQLDRKKNFLCFEKEQIQESSMPIPCWKEDCRLSPVTCNRNPPRSDYHSS